MTNTAIKLQALAELLNDRYSCRAFTDQPVPEADMREMFAVAQRTPSWCNSQAWQVVVTSGETTDKFRAGLRQDAANTPSDTYDIPGPEKYTGVYQERRRGAGFGLYGALGIARDDYDARNAQMALNFDLFGAPHTAIITSDKLLGTYGAVDCGAYVSTLLLAAESLGIAAIPQAAVARQSKFVREFFDIGDDRLVVCAVSFGYADHEHPVNSFRTDRASVDEAVDFR
ncbi:nitroreductase [Antricoccus suffuscus]|uniref:Nitroreductase n=1 Tax=Antricoccus suffuscus TaxID=1629062 RepID=A0A2T1A6D2_9ACTN|nr:nitroreductase [Antricoccus suffuscus]PRZ44114.1 nitroreductase [Antricoccus suffuscus]